MKSIQQSSSQLSDLSKNHRTSYDTQWKGAAKIVTQKNISGLRVKCPKCKHHGTLFSKWIRGPQIKPLFVCHADGNNHLRVCSVSKEEAEFLRTCVSFFRADILKTIRFGKPIILFSGGQDSLCLLNYINILAKSIKKQVIAVHANTTAGFPEVGHYVQEVCGQLNIPLIIVRPNHDYFELAKKWGIPGVKSRWCCETLKIAPIRRYLAQIEGNKVIFDGIRAAESSVRAKYLPIWYHPSFRCFSISPLFYWSDTKIQEYIESKSLPISPVAKLNTSAECWCGAYKSRKDFESLLNIHPEIFDKLIEIENAQKGKYTFLYEKGKRIPLCSLKKRNKDKRRE